MAWCLDVLADNAHPQFDTKIFRKKVWLIRRCLWYIKENNFFTDEFVSAGNIQYISNWGVIYKDSQSNQKFLKMKRFFCRLWSTQRNR